MQNMAKFQPQIKELQKKYANDRERLNQETMKFYRENKVNPFASCLPLLAQLPVFLALFYMLQNDLRYEICPERQPPRPAGSVVCGDGGDAQFFFIPDLTNNATGAVLIALIVLYVGSQLASTLLMSTTRTGAAVDLPGAAVLLRAVRDQLPGGPAGVLDHHEPVDHRPAGDRAQAGRAAATTGIRARPRAGRAVQTGRGQAPPASKQQSAEARSAPAPAAAAARQGEGAPDGTAAAPPEEEEALGAAPMSDAGRARGGAVARIAEALGLDARRRSSRRAGTDPRGPPRRRPRPLHRAPRPDDRRRATPGVQDGRAVGRPGRRVDGGCGRLPRAPPPRAPAPGRPGRRRAVRSRRPVALDAMSANERKVVHEYLKDRDDVETYSEGTEPGPPPSRGAAALTNVNCAGWGRCAGPARGQGA